MANNDNIKQVLNPARFPGMSPKMMAVVGYIIEKPCTRPAIAELVATSDGILMARVEGDYGCNDIVGTLADFKRNWLNLIHVAHGLSSEEIAYLEILPSVMIRNYGE